MEEDEVRGTPLFSISAKLAYIYLIKYIAGISENCPITHNLLEVIPEFISM